MRNTSDMANDAKNVNFQVSEKVIQTFATSLASEIPKVFVMISKKDLESSQKG